MTDQPSITETRHLEADPEDVFRAWLDPELARLWLFVRSGRPAERCEIDARDGGRFVILDRRDDGDAYFVGIYEEIDPPHRLIFRFATGRSADIDPAEGGRVTVTVVPEKTGASLTLVQDIPPAYVEYADRMRDGWKTLLAALASHLGVWVEKPDTKPFRGDIA